MRQSQRKSASLSEHPNGRRIINPVQRLMILCGDGIEPTQREIVDSWFAKNHSGSTVTPPMLAPSSRTTDATCTNFTEQTRAQSVGPDALFRCV
jgi:hypothetical protein